LLKTLGELLGVKMDTFGLDSTQKPMIQEYVELIQVLLIQLANENLFY
jgi:hypothetical protein